MNTKYKTIIYRLNEIIGHSKCDYAKKHAEKILEDLEAMQK